MLEADKPKTTIGWVCREYSGTEVFKVNADNKVVPTPLTKESDLRTGTKVCVTILVGDYIMTVESDSYGVLSAYTDSKGMMAILKFNEDDRHCWTSPGSINLGAIKKLRKETVCT